MITELLYLIKRYREFDPATDSALEILLFYPGVKAVLSHRLAHKLKRYKVPLLPRAICELSKLITTIEIHPDAKIGKGLIIDHGLGVAIGATAVIGDDVIMMPGSVLAARRFEWNKRHPTIGDRVFIGIGAKVLGNVNIGNDAKIGANSVVLTDIPPFATAVGIPAMVVSEKREKIEKKAA